MTQPLPPGAGRPAAAAPAPDASSAAPSPSPHYDTEYYGTPTLLHAASLAAAVLAPIGMMLPPRRMGARSILLAAGTFFATSQLTYDYTGESLYQRFRRRMNQFSANQAQDLPPAALRRQAAMRAERERRRQQQQQQQEEQPAAAPAAAAADANDNRLHRLWMGNEKDDWAKERARKEQETLASGGGYWDLIMAQIGEVATDLMGKGTKPEKGAAAAPPSADAKK